MKKRDPKKLQQEHENPNHNKRTLMQAIYYQIEPLINGFKIPSIRHLLLIRFAIDTAFMSIQSVFPSSGRERFGLLSQQMGYILSFVGVFTIITQGFIIGQLTKRFNEAKLVTFAAFILFIAQGLNALSTSLIVFLCAMGFSIISGGVLRTCLMSLFTKTIDKSNTGSMMGVSASVESFTRIIAPSIGGFLISYTGHITSTEFFASFLTFCVWLYLLKSNFALTIPKEKKLL